MSYQIEVAEALCSALYQLPFTEFLGEQDLPWAGTSDVQEARVAYFHVGEPPKDMRVTIVRPSKSELVEVLVEWRNYFADGRNPLKGEQRLTVTTYALNEGQSRTAAEQVVLKVLELYKDVLSEDGVAGKIDALVDADEEVSE